MINKFQIYLGITALCFAIYFYFDKFTKTNEIKNSKKTIIFLDIDGTLTSLKGEAQYSVYNMYLNNKDSWYNNKDVINILFENKEKFDNIKNFIKAILDSKIELIITTNNFKTPIQQLFEKILHIDFDKISKRSAFRESNCNKVKLINEIILNTEIEQEIYYFEDDNNYLTDPELIKLSNKINIIDCSNNKWLGNRLPQIFNNLSASDLTNLLNILKFK